MSYQVELGASLNGLTVFVCCSPIRSGSDSDPSPAWRWSAPCGAISGPRARSRFLDRVYGAWNSGRGKQIDSLETTPENEERRPAKRCFARFLFSKFNCFVRAGLAAAGLCAGLVKIRR